MLHPPHRRRAVGPSGDSIQPETLNGLAKAIRDMDLATLKENALEDADWAEVVDPLDLMLDD